MAAYPDAVHLIVSLTRRDSPVLGAFHIRDGDVEEVDIVIKSAERVKQ